MAKKAFVVFDASTGRGCGSEAHKVAAKGRIRVQIRIFMPADTSRKSYGIRGAKTSDLKLIYGRTTKSTAIYCHSKARKPLKMAKNGLFLGECGSLVWEASLLCKPLFLRSFKVVRFKVVRDGRIELPTPTVSRWPPNRVNAKKVDKSRQIPSALAAVMR